MRISKYTNDEFVSAVTTSTSIAEVLRKLHLREAGGNYSSIKKKMSALGLSLAKGPNGQSWAKGKTFQPKRSVEEYLNNSASINSFKLKLRLLKEGIKQAKCECCGITEWNSKPAPLELDHINGNGKDNSLTNLRLLCPNCHAQTDTYRGKNISKKLQ